MRKSLTYIESSDAALALSLGQGPPLVPDFDGGGLLGGLA